MEKQTKTIEDQGEKQIRVIEEDGKHLVESSEVIRRNNFNIDRDDEPLEKQGEILRKLLEEKDFEFNNLGDKINSNDLIYEFQTEERSLKDFKDYKNPIELLKNLRDGNVNPKEILKNQMRFKSDLDEIKKGNLIFKSKNQKNTIGNIDNFFYFMRKNYQSF